jgi:hypothetical protein
MHGSTRWRLVGLFLGLTLLLGGCSHDQGVSVAAGGDDDINVHPASYKPDLLNAMHAYLNDPTGIRDASISDLMLKSVGGANRYVVCLRFNAKKGRNGYAGVKEIAAVFVAGRFDRFVEMPREAAHETMNETPRGPCADATYTPFPELGKLSR